jgi:endoglucanase
VGRALPLVKDAAFTSAVTDAAKAYRAEVEALEKKTPYGVPYEPQVWGADWGIQAFGMEQYFLHAAFPGIFPLDGMLHALDFVLGVHPGPNNASFVSGVGSRSVTVGYGFNRADWSYIPGGSVSGTALIRPDYPELLEWPYLWQQTEYVLGGGTTDYLFLVLAADDLLNRD